jgi:hypothetical protein
MRYLITINLFTKFISEDTYMRRTAGAILFSIMLAALTLAGAYAPALAVEWPVPPEGWWESLSPGDTATFDIAVDTEPPERTEIVIKILDVKGSKITLSIQTNTDGTPTPEQTYTVDVKSMDMKSSIPDYATVTKIGEKVFKAGDQSFKCTEYRVKTYDTSTNICNSLELPVIFSDGNVIMETKYGDVTSTMILKEYTGKKIEE